MFSNVQFEQSGDEIEFESIIKALEIDGFFDEFPEMNKPLCFAREYERWIIPSKFLEEVRNTKKPYRFNFFVWNLSQKNNVKKNYHYPVYWALGICQEQDYFETLLNYKYNNPDFDLKEISITHFLGIEFVKVVKVEELINSLCSFNALYSEITKSVYKIFSKEDLDLLLSYVNRYIARNDLIDILYDRIVADESSMVLLK